MLDGIMRVVLRPGILAVLLVVQVLLLIGFAITLRDLTAASGGYGLLDFEFGYDRDRVAEVLGAYGDAGMRTYRRVQALDLVNPAVYGLLGAALIHWLAQGSGRSRLGWLVLAVAGLDYAENAVLAMLAWNYPQVDVGQVGLGNALSLGKHGLLAVVGIAVVFLVFRRFRRIPSP